MYTREAIQDIYERTQRSLTGLIDHCASIDNDALGQSMAGFGYDSILQQLYHIVGAEQYWIGVLQGKMLVDEDDADRATIDAIRAFRERVSGTTRAWLESATSDELSEARPFDTWSEKQVSLTPAHVVMRTQTHAFQHQGQITAMCRLLGHPVPAGLDFPVR